MERVDKIEIYCDGGARGNPGKAAIGVVIFSDGKIVSKWGRVIGISTNNVAEYQAVVDAFEYLKSNKIFSQETWIYLDSKVVTNQLTGAFKTKEVHLQNLLWEVRTLEGETKVYPHYLHIPREKNILADQLVNQALDGQLSSK